MYMHVLHVCFGLFYFFLAGKRQINLKRKKKKKKRFVVAEGKRLLQGLSLPSWTSLNFQKRGCIARIPPSAMACLDILSGRSKPTGEKTCPKCSLSLCLSSAQGSVSLVMLKDSLPVTGLVSS